MTTPEADRPHLELAAQRKTLQAKLLKGLQDSQGMSGNKLGWIMAEMHATIGMLAGVGNQEIAETHAQLTKRTDQLTRATRRLIVATWILFFATLGLCLVKVYEVFRQP